jgi:hypothetical protein
MLVLPQDAPYVLEAFADQWADEEPPVKLVRLCRVCLTCHHAWQKVAAPV